MKLLRTGALAGVVFVVGGTAYGQDDLVAPDTLSGIAACLPGDGVTILALPTRSDDMPNPFEVDDDSTLSDLRAGTGLTDFNTPYAPVTAMACADGAVPSGISAARTKYTSYVIQKAEVKRQRDALEDLTGDALTRAQERLSMAEDRLDELEDDMMAYGGQVYSAVYAEESAIRALNSAYDELVGEDENGTRSGGKMEEFQTAQTALDALTFDYDSDGDGTDDGAVAISTIRASLETAETALETAQDNYDASPTNANEDLLTTARMARDRHADALIDAMNAHPAETSTYRTAKAEFEAARTAFNDAALNRLETSQMVHDQLTTFSSFLEQQVELRRYEDDAARQELADARQAYTEAETDSARRRAQRDIDRAEDKVLGARNADGEREGGTAAALEKAMMARDKHASYLDSGSALHELVDALVRTDDTGQAVVNAIGSTYADIEANTANITENATDIETNADMIADLTGVDGAVSRNTAAIADHETRISDNETMLMDHEGRITTNEATLADHGMKLMQKKQYIDNLGMHIGIDPVTGMGTGEGGMSRIDMNEAGIAANRDFIEHNHEHILEHSALIESNQMSIMRNTEDIQTLKSGVAASMALAGMPEMGARGVSVGAGSYGGETALAVGVHFSGENARFKIGVTSSGGETGASLGAGWSF